MQAPSLSTFCLVSSILVNGPPLSTLYIASAAADSPKRPSKTSIKTFQDWKKSSFFRVTGADGTNTILQTQHGSIQQDGYNQEAVSEFIMLRTLVDKNDVAKMLELLRSAGTKDNPLDVDSDTVDGMPSFELFADNENIRSGGNGKGDLEYAGWTKKQTSARKHLRDSLNAISSPIIKNRIIPYLRELYPSRLMGRAMTPCYSLFRRYTTDDRQSHDMHHDGHAFATVVVSLSDYDREYRGGLYVSTTRGGERKFIPLSRGDAVIHRNDLLHGVQVFGIEKDEEQCSTRERDTCHNRKRNTELQRRRAIRYSWILWFRDSETCEDHSSEWYIDCAERGNPTCEHLLATKVPTNDEVVKWMTRSADHGFGASRVKLARAYLKKLPSSLEFNMTKAAELYQAAVKDSQEPDAHYGMAELILLAGGKMGAVSKVIHHLEQGAAKGNRFAMFNLGIAHLYGYYPVKKKYDHHRLACDWFEESGLPEGYFGASLYYKAVGRQNEVKFFEKRAKLMGHGTKQRQMARQHTGSGGAGGVDINLPWPNLGADTPIPPQF